MPRTYKGAHVKHNVEYYPRGTGGKNDIKSTSYSYTCGNCGYKIENQRVNLAGQLCPRCHGHNQM